MLWHRHITLPDERPAFTQMADIEQPTINGYTLQVNLVDHSASIINLKKGGNQSMVKTVVKALEGFEKLYDEVSEMKANLESEKAEAIKVAVAQVEARYAEKSSKIDELFAKVSVTEEIEVPDEVTEENVEVAEEVAEQVEPVEEVPEEGTGISF